MKEAREYNWVDSNFNKCFSQNWTITFQTFFFPNTKLQFVQQLLLSFFTPHPHSFLWVSLDKWGPLLSGHSTKVQNLLNAYHLKFLWYTAAKIPSLTQISFPLLSWNNNTSVIDVRRLNGPSEGNIGIIWIPDILSIVLSDNYKLRNWHIPRLLEY